MKKLLRILILLFLIAVAVVAVFLTLFDADRFRPILTGRIEAVLGRPVQMERISLGWRGGIALELKALSIYSDLQAKEQSKPSLQVGKISATLQLAPLLKREIQLASIALERPQIHLLRKPEGTLDVAGLTPLPEKPEERGKEIRMGAEPQPHPQAAKALPLLIRLLEVTDGTVEVTDLSLQPPLKLTLQDFSLRASIKSDQVRVHELSGKLGEGILSLKGNLERLTTHPQGEIQGRLERLALEQILPPSIPGQPEFQGRLSTSFSVHYSQEILSGEADVRLEESRVKEMNILRTVFDRLTIVPGLTQTLLARLPESYREKLNAQDTAFQPIRFQIILRGKEIFVEELRVATEEFELIGSPHLGWDGSLNFPAQIRIEPQLSSAIIQSVEGLRFLADDQGRLSLPALIEGTLPNLSVMPDVQYVASRLIRSKGEELVGDLLDKLLKRP